MWITTYVGTGYTILFLYYMIARAREIRRNNIDMYPRGISDLKMNLSASSASGSYVPQFFESQIIDAPSSRHFLHFFGDVFLRRSSHVDIVAIAAGVMTRNSFPESIRSIRACSEEEGKYENDETD